MKRLLLSFAFFSASLAASLADEISTSNIYVGKKLSFCGKIECVSVSSNLYGDASAAKQQTCAIQFSVKQPNAVFCLEFNVKKDSENARLLKSGSIVRAKGVCKEYSVTGQDAKENGDGRSRIELRMDDASVEELGSGEPEGFVCNDAKPSAETAEAQPKNPAPSPAANTRRKPKAAQSSESRGGFNEADAMRSIVTVQGKNGSGSAFIAAVDGRTFLATNIHVMFDNEPKFLSVSNDSIEVNPPLLAKDRDLALYELKDPAKFHALPLDEDIIALPPEAPVIVFGNSMGAGVNTRLKGNIKGIGPTTVEISAKIVPGNSGSPIIDMKTGKVVGISTFGTSGAKAGVHTKGTRFEEVRRFGTRIDNISLDSMEPFDAKGYALDIKIQKEIEALNKLGYTFLSDIYSGKNGKLNLTLSPSKYDFAKHSGLERLVNDWNSALRNGWSDNIPLLLKRMKDQVSQSAEQLRKQKPFYSWTRNELKRELEINESYSKAIDDLRKEIEEALKNPH